MEVELLLEPNSSLIDSKVNPLDGESTNRM